MDVDDFIERWREGGPRPQRVAFDNEGVTRTTPDGRTEHVRWDELESVVIVTTDEGPMVEDVYWLLAARGGKSGCAVPGSAEGMDALLDRLQRLPGFDNEAVIRAMACTENTTFVCWRRPG